MTKAPRTRPWRIAMVETHPIQYKVPWFRALSACPGLDVEVFYAMLPSAAQQGVGFGVAFQWDQPLLDGYRYRVLRNVAREPSLLAFGGCDTPELYRVLSAAAEPRWDAVIVNGWVAKSCVQALAACRLAGIPCVVRGESNARQRRPAWKRWVHRLLLSQYARVLYIGASNREFYRQSGVSGSRLCFGPYGVDNARFEQAAAELAPRQAALREAFGIGPGKTVVLFSGKLEPKKRPLDVLEAVRQARAGARPGTERLHVLVAGDGPLRGECERWAAAQGVPASFAGFLNQSDMPKAYAAADVLVLPSDAGETWGLVVNEAMASGRPVLVSEAVGCREDLVLAGQTGASFPLGRCDELGARLAEVAAEPGRWAAMGAAARERVRGYSVERLVAGTLEALYSLGMPGSVECGGAC